MKKKIFLIFVILVLFFGFWKIFHFLFFEGQLLIETNKKEYKKGEVIKIKIENQTNREVCFSSCFPYFLEKKEENWTSYPYENCSQPNLATNCIKPKEKKFFQIENLFYTREGIHRLSIPVCFCKLGKNFKENKRFFSNEFLIE